MSDPKKEKKKNIITKNQLRYRIKIHHRSPKYRKRQKMTQILIGLKTLKTFAEFKNKNL